MLVLLQHPSPFSLSQQRIVIIRPASTYPGSFAATSDPFAVAAGARVLLRAAGGQGAVRELRGGAVPGATAAAPAAPPRQRGALLPQPVRRGTEGTATLLRAEEAGGSGSRLSPAAAGSHDMRCSKYRH